MPPSGFSRPKNEEPPPHALTRGIRTRRRGVRATWSARSCTAAATSRNWPSGVAEMQAGDLLMFADWRGDPDERLTGLPGSEVGRVLEAASRRGVDVRGLVAIAPRQVRLSPVPRTGASARRSTRRAASACWTCASERGVLTTRSSSSSVIPADRSGTSRSSAGSTLATAGVTTTSTSAIRSPSPWHRSTGPRPPWHDLQVAITGPAVGDVETVFRERWEDPGAPSRSPAALGCRRAPP